MGVNRSKTPKIVWGNTAVSGESLGTGDGTATTFSGTLVNQPVHRKTLTITAGGSSVTDDGEGTLSGDGTGTINYDTGAYSVTWSAAPALNTAVTGAYEYFPYTLSFPYPLDTARSYTLPRPGSRVARGQAGLQDAWDTGWDYHLEGAVRWIPGASWDGSTGWEALIQWARGRKVRFHPDKDSATHLECYVHPDMELSPEVEEDGTRILPLRLVHTSAFTGY